MVDDGCFHFFKRLIDGCLILSQERLHNAVEQVDSTLRLGVPEIQHKEDFCLIVHWNPAMKQITIRVVLHNITFF